MGNSFGNKFPNGKYQNKQQAQNDGKLKERPNSAQIKDPKNTKDIVPEKQRPASGGAMRHFSPAQKGKSKINKNLPYSTYSVGKNNKAGLRYPSPQINSSGNHNSMYSQSYKWK